MPSRKKQLPALDDEFAKDLGYEKLRSAAWVNME